MSSIQFDGTNIADTNHAPQFIKHESAPDRVVTSLVPALDDGEIVVSDQRGKKTILLQGILSGTSQADLENSIDVFKELFSRLEKNLDIDWNGSTRRYVATCTKHEFDRDYMNIGWVPWTAEFTIYSGEGKDTSMTTALSAHSVTVTTPGTDSFTMAGSKAAKPVITLTGAHSAGAALGIEYKNTDTGEKIVITNAAGLGSSGLDTVIIDCLQKKITADFNSSNYSVKPFYGVFPKFTIGTNNVQISVGNLTNQASGDASFTTASNAANLWGSIKVAQSFVVPYGDATFQSVILSLNKNGSPTSTIDCRIETDSNGQPSGSLADSNLNGFFSASTVPSGNTAFQVSFSSPGTLKANTRYWIVLQSNASGDDGSNNLSVHYDNANNYPNGSGMTYSGSWGPAFFGQFRFKVNYGGLDGFLASVAHTVTYFKTFL